MSLKMKIQCSGSVHMRQEGRGQRTAIQGMTAITTMIVEDSTPRRP